MNGAIADAEALWKARMNNRCPSDPTMPMPTKAARSEVGDQPSNGTKGIATENSTVPMMLG